MQGAEVNFIFYNNKIAMFYIMGSLLENVIKRSLSALLVLGPRRRSCLFSYVTLILLFTGGA